jgi:serine acetyltransferase
LKATPIDYILSSLVICLLIALTAALLWVWVPISRQLFLDYHVLADAVVGLACYGTLSALLVRAVLLVRPIVAGSYEMDSSTFIYWKLLTVTYRLGQAALVPLIPIFLRPLVEKLYGANIGKDVALGGVIDDPYLVSVGDGTVLGHASLVSANYISGGKLICGPVKIGTNVTLGANAVVFPGVEIGDNATVMAGSCLMPGMKIPGGETWRGNPARKWLA